MSSRYTVVLSKLAQEKFDKFIRNNRKIGEQIAKAIDRLASNPEIGEFLKGPWRAIENTGLEIIGLSTVSNTIG